MICLPMFIHLFSRLILRLCDLRRLPGKGPHNLRNYDVAAIVTLQKCNWESKAVPAKELVTRLNEELNLPYMPNEPLKVSDKFNLI